MVIYLLVCLFIIVECNLGQRGAALSLLVYEIAAVEIKDCFFFLIFFYF
jgi:hypothetical protein